MNRFVFALSLALLAASAAAATSDDALARLASAVAERPSDAALARALARAQLERGDAEAALATLRAHVARNPGDRAKLAQLLGRALYAQGELDEARLALGDAIVQRETDALTHLYLGLVLLRLDERDAAALELERAEQLDPSLAERVRRASRPARSAWHRALERFAFAGGTGLEYDTNPALESDEGIAPVAGDSKDERLSYMGALAAQLFHGETGDLSLSYRFDESRHEDLDDLDVQSHTAWLGGALAFTPSWFGRLEGGGALHRLDHSTFLRTASVGSGIGLRSERFGLIELRAQAERRAYEEPPSLPSLERDGWRFGGVLRSSLPVTLWAPVLITTQLTYARMLTDGERDLLGFGPAFDSHLGALDTALRAPLPLGFRLDARLALGVESFDSRNLIDFLSDDGVGDPEPERRLDHVIDSSLSLSRPLSRWLELELRARETRHFSNVDLYDWDRQIFGTYLRLFWKGR